MANKKSSPKKSSPEKPVINKIATQVGNIAGELAARKDHFVEIAGDAIASVKSTIQNFTATKKSTPKKTGKAKAKKAITKTASPDAKKPTKPIPAKKTTPSKKPIKKITKKTAIKK